MYSAAKCEAKKKTRFVAMCYSLAAVSSAAEGDMARAAVDAMLAIVSGTCDPNITYVGYSIAAIALALEGRPIGTVGFVAKALGRYDLANPLLAFHYGLMSFDAADEPVASRIAHGALAINYAM